MPTASSKHEAKHESKREPARELNPTRSLTPAHDPTPALARQVLELYAEALRDVRFPDLDLALLEEAREALLVSQLEVERSEAQLQAARVELEAKSDALHTKAERALAYARVFALGDPALSARLAELGARKKPLTLVEGGSTPVKRRGRSKKEAVETELFVAEEADGPALEAAADSGEPNEFAEPNARANR
jgi:hypothetical protein